MTTKQQCDYIYDTLKTGEEFMEHHPKMRRYLEDMEDELKIRGFEYYYTNNYSKGRENKYFLYELKEIIYPRHLRLYPDNSKRIF